MSRFDFFRPAVLGGVVLCVMIGGCTRQGKTDDAPAAPGVTRPDGAPPSPATRTALTDPFAELYADQGGEEVLPSEPLPAGAPLRARRGDTFFRLSNPRFEPVGKKPFPFIAVDYQRTHDGPYGGQALMIRSDSGRDQPVMIMGPMWDRAGTLEINLGIAPPGTQHPKNAELYFVRQESRYPDPAFRPTFKVSTSVVMGAVRFPMTLARNWTAEEAAVLRHPPPEGAKFNVHPNAGEDTTFVGNSDGGSFRYAEPGKPVLGVDYYSGEWDKEPCLARLIPVYAEIQPREGGERLMARNGYAVGGMTVKSKRYVNAVQITFMKRKPDGSLDPRDAYVGGWLGKDLEGAKETKLGGDGRPVIGFHCRQGGILNAVALVLERP